MTQINESDVLARIRIHLARRGRHGHTIVRCHESMRREPTCFGATWMVVDRDTNTVLYGVKSLVDFARELGLVHAEVA